MANINLYNFSSHKAHSNREEINSIESCVICIKKIQLIQKEDI